MPKISSGAVALLAASVFASAVPAQSPAGVAAQPGDASAQGMTYDSLQDLPDFSGWWSLTPESIAGALAPLPPPLKPKAAAVMKEWTAKIAAGQDPSDVDGLKRSYCGPARFSGFNGGLQDYIEFLFTPGRVTIANELGLVRRVSLNRPLPQDHAETNSGVSVGHWEGRTLVVETGGLRPDIGLGEPRNKLPIEIGHNARIIERISLKEPDVLEIVSQTTAPDLLTQPYQTTSLLRRDRRHEFQELTNCVLSDRAFDNATGRERFDMPPPADLPPPPSK
jgi:hypothetical protein